jgi:hypothetical protein
MSPGRDDPRRLLGREARVPARGSRIAARARGDAVPTDESQDSDDAHAIAGSNRAPLRS